MNDAGLASADAHFAATGLTCEVTCDRAALPELCGRLFLEWEFSFAGLIVEEGASEWQLRYCFYGDGEAGWVHVLVSAPLHEKIFPSIVKFVHAADWHEREAEDLFGLSFEGHPRLGDFVLHNDTWQEDVEPMRRRISIRKRRCATASPDADWRPRRIVEEPGAFVMPIGPKYLRRDGVGSFSARNRRRRRHSLRAAPVLQMARDREARRGQNGG